MIWDQTLGWQVFVSTGFTEMEIYPNHGYMSTLYNMTHQVDTCTYQIVYDGPFGKSAESVITSIANKKSPKVQQNSASRIGHMAEVYTQGRRI